jgi:outer membrane receptor for ferrienterochelin and colicins
MKTKSASAALLYLLSLPACSYLLAQDSALGDSTITFPASYFSEFAPVTINDMLDRVPGIDLIRGGSGIARDGDRGLGSEARILIDGKRLAGKANEIDSQLQRISADQVDYIEIVRGTSSDLDVQNSGQLLNIVLLESQSRSNVSTEAFMDYHEDGTTNPGGSLSYSGQSGVWTYLFSGQVGANYRRQGSFETSLNADLSANENFDQTRTTESDDYSFNANMSYSPSGNDRFALNFQYNESDPLTDVFRIFTDFNDVDVRSYHEREDIPSSNESWEVGGDYEHGFQNGDRFKALFIVNEENGDVLRQKYLAGSVGGIEDQTLYLDTSSRYRERIVRSSYIKSLGSNQGIEVGVEAAQTIQYSSLLYAIPTSAPGNPLYGGLTSIPLPNANSTVEEMRYEPFLIHNWQINSRMSLESSLVAEWSEIEQAGDISNSRDFDYIKPKFDFRFDINNSLQFRASLENVVSQLGFGDFSRNTNERDDDQDTVAGNPELEPEESWRVEAGLDYRLPNDGGALNARYFYYDYDNKIGKVDVSPDADNLQSTNGNVGTAQAYGLIVNSSIRLGFIGLPSALLTANLTLQESEFDDDPFTPREHGFAPFDRGGLRAGFRHDVTSLNLSYGFNWMLLIKDGRRGFDVDNEFDFTRPDAVSAFVEKVGFGGLTYRLEANNLSDFHACGIRYRYHGYVIDNDLKEIEQNCFTTGRSVSLRVRGTF